MQLHLVRVLTLGLCLVACATQETADRNVFEPAVERVVRRPDAIEFLSLHPAPYTEAGKPTGKADDFHGYRILAGASFPEHRWSEPIGLVKQGILDSDGTVAACFNPRHGLRFTRGSVVVEFVICYECMSLDVHGPSGAQEGHLTVSGTDRALSALFREVGLEIHRGD